MFDPLTPISEGQSLGRADALATMTVDSQCHHNRPELLHATLSACATALAALAGTMLSVSSLIQAAEPPAIAARQPRSRERDAQVGASLPLFDPAPAAYSDAAPAQCAAHLLAASLDCRDGQSAAVRDLISRARHSEDAAARHALLDYGLKSAPFPRTAGAPICLLVATAHPKLARLFLGTPWSDRRWSASLRDLPGAVVPRNPVSFRVGVKPRAVAVPLESLGFVAETERPHPAPIPDANARHDWRPIRRPLPASY